MTPNYTYAAELINVVDGDTVDLKIDLGFSIFSIHRVRLMRVDTPEMNDKDPAVRDAAKLARAFVLVQLSQGPIVIQSFKSDSFGRYLAELWVKDATGEFKNLSDALLASGNAVEFKR